MVFNYTIYTGIRMPVAYRSNNNMTQQDICFYKHATGEINKMKSCTMCTSFMLQSPKADESMMVMAGLLTYSFLAAFPPDVIEKWHGEPGIALL